MMTYDHEYRFQRYVFVWRTEVWFKWPITNASISMENIFLIQQQQMVGKLQNETPIKDDKWDLPFFFFLSFLS